MNVKEMKDILNRYNDDFEVEFRLNKLVSIVELEKRQWKMPYDTTETLYEFGDVSYSDKVIQFDIYEVE